MDDAKTKEIKAAGLISDDKLTEVTGGGGINAQLDWCGKCNVCSWIIGAPYYQYAMVRQAADEHAASTGHSVVVGQPKK